MTRARDWMTPLVLTIDGAAPLEHCARGLVARGIRHLPVVDDDGRLTGLVSDLDVFRHGRLVGDDGDTWMADTGADLRARDLAQPVEVVCVPGDDVLRLIDHLADSTQDAAVVVDAERHPVGIFTEHDGVRLAAGRLDPELTTAHLSSAPVHTVRDTDPAARAVELVRAHGIRHVVVVDGQGVCGVLSVRDLMAGGAVDQEQVSAGELVRAGPVHVLEQGGSLRTAAERMARHTIGCLPVVGSGGVPERIVTRTDLLRALAARIRGRAIQQT